MKYFLTVFVFMVIFSNQPAFAEPGTGALSSQAEEPYAGGLDRIFKVLCKIPYRPDGALNEKGEYTLFAKQDSIFKTPGLNCSGFVLAGMRTVLAKDITLSEVTKDRLGDSAPGSKTAGGKAGGQDWDFGWDFILNISDGFKRHWLLPDGKTLDPDAVNCEANGQSVRGYDLHAKTTWDELPARILLGRLYLLSFSKTVKKSPYTLMHYHVAVLYRDLDGVLTVCHTTHERGSSYCQEIDSKEGRQAFLHAFANTGDVRKMLLPLELEF